MSLDSSCPWWKHWNVIDYVDRCLLYSYIMMQRVDTGVLGNELRLEVLLNGNLTGLWEPELLLVGRGSNTYFMQKYDNTFIKCIWCYSEFFCDILSLNVKMYLWLKLYTVPFFVSGQTYKISKVSNNYCSHCTSGYIKWFNVRVGDGDSRIHRHFDWCAVKLYFLQYNSCDWHAVSRWSAHGRVGGKSVNLI